MIDRLIAASLFASIAAPASAASADDPRRGFWWYQAPPKPESPPPAELLAKPVIPPMAELATWTPPRIHALIEAQRDYAATVLTVDAVADFWKLEDFARRKARAFAGVTQIALLQHPELNAKSANPMVGDARDVMVAQQDATRRSYLRAHANEYAMVMFGRPSCGYCRVQWPILERFREETGWQLIMMDLDQHPEFGSRFGVDVTPTTMVIRRGATSHMVIASGVEAYPNLAQMAYQAVRLLGGDIRPEQFMNDPGDDGGFFDALAHGPVSASDPHAASADLVDTSGTLQP